MDTCFRCGEPVTHEDRCVLEVVIPAEGPPTERPSHWECQARSVLGSVGHIQGRCSCFGGTEEDPPGLTKREAALAAVAAFRLIRMSLRREEG